MLYSSPAIMAGRKPQRLVPLILMAGALLVGLWLSSLWQPSEAPATGERSSRQLQEKAVLPTDRATAASQPAEEPKSLPSNIDLSPPPGAITQRPSSDWPFSAPWQEKAAVAYSLQETTRTQGRASSAKALAASASAPTPPTTAVAKAAAASTDFEAPPGLGSSRGAK